MKAEELEAMLFDVYKHGVEHEDCDLTRRVRKIEQHTNQRLIEELDLLRQKLTHISFTAHCIDEINDRIKELKQE